MRVSKPSLGSISQELYEPVTEGKHCLTPPPSLRRAVFLLSLLLALPTHTTLLHPTTTTEKRGSEIKVSNGKCLYSKLSLTCIQSSVADYSGSIYSVSQ